MSKTQPALSLATCPECGQGACEDALFCRGCLAELPGPISDDYADEHFQAIREWSRQYLCGEVPAEAFLENLEGFAGRVMLSLHDVQPMATQPVRLADLPVDHTLDAMNSFLQGLQTIAIYTQTGDPAHLLDGLEMAETANHLLNRVIRQVDARTAYPLSTFEAVA